MPVQQRNDFIAVDQEQTPRLKSLMVKTWVRTRQRVIISLLILAVFWGAVLYDYWPDLLQTFTRAVNATRVIGSKPLQSRYFEIRNLSSASDSQIAAAVAVLDKQYETLTRYLKTIPPNPLPLLFVNGSGPAFDDGSQLVINDDKGVINTDLAPVFMALMIDDIKVDLAGSYISAGGYALSVGEASGLGSRMTWQPLDAWVVLLRRHRVYMPLQEAWAMKVPSDDNGAYSLVRAILESGSFMRWFADRYGLSAARLVAHGEAIEKVSGNDLAWNEAQWLASLESQHLQPKACADVLPEESMFRFICVKIDSGLK